MEVKIRFPEAVGREVDRLSDRDAFVSSAVAKALELQRARRKRLDSESPTTTAISQEPSEGQLPPLNGRDREDAWRRSNRAVLRRHYAGQWVVLEGEEIVAHSEDAAEAVQDARAKAVAVPFVFYVEPPRPPGLVRMGF